MKRLVSIWFIELALAVFMVCLCVVAISGQTPQLQSNTAPPPLKVITPDDRAALEHTKDAKSRVKRTIELGEAHLTKAETHTSRQEFTEASAELGRYWALIEDVFRVLAPLNHDATKTRDMYKRIELALRAHGARLTTIRRTTPLEYAVWIKKLEDYARKGRTEALNSFYGHTVVRESPPMQLLEDEKRAAGTISPPEKQP
jgi:hypothetical protein